VGYPCTPFNGQGIGVQTPLICGRLPVMLTYACWVTRWITPSQLSGFSSPIILLTRDTPATISSWLPFGLLNPAWEGSTPRKLIIPPIFFLPPSLPAPAEWIYPSSPPPQRPTHFFSAVKFFAQFVVFTMFHPPPN